MDREDEDHNVIPGEWRDGRDLPYMSRGCEWRDMYGRSLPSLHSSGMTLWSSSSLSMTSITSVITVEDIRILYVAVSQIILYNLLVSFFQTYNRVFLNNNNVGCSLSITSSHGTKLKHITYTITHRPTDRQFTQVGDQIITTLGHIEYLGLPCVQSAQRKQESIRHN